MTDEGKDFCAMDYSPPMGQPVQVSGKIVVYHKMSGKKRIDEDMPSYMGSQLLGHEGEWGAYFHWRTATKADMENIKSMEEFLLVSPPYRIDKTVLIKHMEKYGLDISEE